ncbi:hypothetical protein [Neisseria zoodegmatis]|uniref:Uncharacterized protein n=1 Tax=Neisseria zoodegmatis TaxID=326523 RepID=A0AB38DN81_9NEIS|nr:hypothetical protein [Neisseria zoodegmatis]OSI09280.1 hypothetical protein BWD10_10145 [Neisseria zoodegmatis]SNU78684.1 Uncharacterised protein [Neisseria zoodegmatis]
MTKVEYTHKGWYLFCPIWIANWQDPSEAPAVAPRYKLEWLFWLADQFFFAMSAMHEMKTGWPLPFCFKVCPEPLKKPVVHHYK